MSKQLEGLLDAMYESLAIPDHSKQETEYILFEISRLENQYKKRTGHYYTPKHKYLKKID